MNVVDTSTLTEEWASDPHACGPQVIYCPNPNCYSKRWWHGKEVRRQTKIGDGHYGHGSKFRQKCWKCKHWVLIEF